VFRALFEQRVVLEFMVLKPNMVLGFADGLRRSEIVGLDCGRDQTEDGRG
jgi:hypothetical protein